MSQTDKRTKMNTKAVAGFLLLLTAIAIGLGVVFTNRIDGLFGTIIAMMVGGYGIELIRESDSKNNTDEKGG